MGWGMKWATPSFRSLVGYERESCHVFSSTEKLEWTCLPRQESLRCNADFPWKGENGSWPGNWEWVRRAASHAIRAVRSPSNGRCRFFADFRWFRALRAAAALFGADEQV